MLTQLHCSRCILNTASVHDCFASHDRSFSCLLFYVPLQSLARGSSLMQPLGGRRPSAQGRSAADIGSDAFAAMERVRVAPADAFFHKYYNLQVS